MRLVGYQPQYFPRLHYIARILDADIFTISDYLQYVRHHIYEHEGVRERGPSYQAHTPIKTAQGILLLDVPVRRGGLDGKQAIHEALVDYSTPWYEKHLLNFQHHYKKAPSFSRVYPALESFLSQKHVSLADVSIGSIILALELLWEKDTTGSLAHFKHHLPHPEFRLARIERLSETGIPPADKTKGEDANDWNIATCKYFGADEYYFGGTSAGAYMDFDRYTRAGITLTQQAWRLTPYRQQFPKSFLPNLSIIDLLMNVSPSGARDIVRTTL